VNSISPLIAWIMVVLTLAVAVFFARQQLRTFAWLQANPELSDDDRRYFHRQAVRRLVGCGLLVVVGTMIAAYYVTGLDDWAGRVADKIEAQGFEAAKQDPEVQRMKDVFRWYCIILLMLLLALVMTAALDYWAIRDYGARHMRQIRDDRKAMIEHELAELRKARGYRNGQG